MCQSRDDALAGKMTPPNDSPSYGLKEIDISIEMQWEGWKDGKESVCLPDEWITKACSIM